MLLEIISPEKKIYQGNVKLVQVPGSKGSFQILNNHAPIVSTLDKGSIKILTDKWKEIFFEIKGGIVEVNKNVITVLAE